MTIEAIVSQLLDEGLGFTQSQIESQVRALRREGDSELQIVRTIRSRAQPDRTSIIGLPTKEISMTKETTDPGAFYGDSPGVTIPRRAAPGATGLAVPAVVITLAALVARLGSVLGPRAMVFLRGLASGGTRVPGAVWARIPSWIKTVLVFLGVDAGVDFLLEGETSEEKKMIPFTAGGEAITGTTGPGVLIIGGWNTNPENPELGVTFYRLSDGRLACQKKNGSWKVWRPKKPIVLYASGAGNLRTMLRADKAVDRQMKKLDKAMKRRGIRQPRRRSSARATGIHPTVTQISQD